MIEFSDVSKIYQVGDSEVRALDHVSMRIDEGEFVAIVGPSGSGKSTMMNIIGCLDTADSGTYLLDGQSIEDYSERELTRIRSQKIGFIFQSFNLIGTMTAAENVELPLIYQRVPKAERTQRVKEALEQVGLEARADHKPNELSGGQQQRVAIARAIASRPSLFLADEPTGNLDSRTGAEIMQQFHRMHEQGNTIVLITHDEGVATQAQRSIHIFDGHIADDSAAPASAAGELAEAGAGEVAAAGANDAVGAGEDEAAAAGDAADGAAPAAEVAAADAGSAASPASGETAADSSAPEGFTEVLPVGGKRRRRKRGKKEAK